MGAALGFSSSQVRSALQPHGVGSPAAKACLVSVPLRFDQHFNRYLHQVIKAHVNEFQFLSGSISTSTKAGTAAKLDTFAFQFLSGSISTSTAVLRFGRSPDRAAFQFLSGSISTSTIGIASGNSLNHCLFQFLSGSISTSTGTLSPFGLDCTRFQFLSGSISTSTYQAKIPAGREFRFSSSQVRSALQLPPSNV